VDVALAVLVSGSGTILEAFLAAGLAVRVVASDRPCRGLEVARSAGVEAVMVDRAEFGGFGATFERERYSAALAAALCERGVDLVAMAGFGTVLSPAFHRAFPGRVLNTHPSLLPAFKGWHAVSATLAAGATETGCTVHVATEALDDGPILAQRRVPVLAGDDEATLHERIKQVERALYPEVVARAIAGLAAGVEPRALVGAGEPS
jgi:phosphoribosylglycinamide formyltransferase 1